MTLFLLTGGWLFRFDKLVVDDKQWELLEMECCQMVYEEPVDSFTTPASSLIVPLTEEHVPQMLELTALTKPGPFFSKTILFGNYWDLLMGNWLL